MSSGLECDVAQFLCCEQRWWEKHVLPFVTEIGAGGEGVLMVSETLGWAAGAASATTSVSEGRYTGLSRNATLDLEPLTDGFRAASEARSCKPRATVTIVLYV